MTDGASPKYRMRQLITKLIIMVEGPSYPGRQKQIKEAIYDLQSAFSALLREEYNGR